MKRNQANNQPFKHEQQCWSSWTQKSLQLYKTKITLLKVKASVNVLHGVVCKPDIGAVYVAPWG